MGFEDKMVNIILSPNGNLIPYLGQKEYLANKGFDEIYGARQLGRVIQQEVKKPMAEELIFGTLAKGGNVNIIFKNNKISFKYSNKNENKNKKELV